MKQTFKIFFKIFVEGDATQNDLFRKLLEVIFQGSLVDKETTSSIKTSGYGTISLRLKQKKLI